MMPSFSTCCFAILCVLAVFTCSEADHSITKRQVGYHGTNCHGQPHAWAFCGGHQYDPHYGFCCNEQFHRHWQTQRAFSKQPRDFHDACCGCTTYNSRQSFCCDGMLIRKNSTIIGSTEQYACCGKSPYLKRKQICCGKTLISKDDCSVRCCGSSVFNYYKQVCCNGIVHKKLPSRRCCGSILYNPHTELCCNGCFHKKSTNSACCGKKTYNYATDICCNGQPHQKVVNGKTRSCCYLYYAGIIHAHPYFVATHICCNGQVHTRSYGRYTACCFDSVGRFVGVYDSKKQRCCHQQSQILPSTPSTVLDLRARCCGNSLFIQTTSKYCCGYIATYNPKTQICCQGTVHLKKTSHICCGQRYIDSRKAACCCNQKVMFIDPKFPTNTICCNSKLYPAGGVCCQNTYFPKKTHCCGPVGYNITINNLQIRCCNHKTGALYHPQLFACCHGKVVWGGKGLPLGQGYACCGSSNIPYNRNEEICCCNCVHKRRINNQHQSCCGKRPFNKATQICCYGTGEIYPKASFNRCCSSITPYRSTTHRCCGYGHVLPLSNQCPT